MIKSKLVSADSLNNPLKKLNAHQRLTPKKPTYWQDFVLKLNFVCNMHLNKQFANICEHVFFLLLAVQIWVGRGRTFLLFSLWPKIIKSLLFWPQNGETLMVVNLENFLTKHPTWTSGTTKWNHENLVNMIFNQNILKGKVTYHIL